jgi:hypothetical protein
MKIYHKKKNWEDVRGNCVKRQYEIAEIAQARIKRRNKYIEKYEAGHPPGYSGSRAPGFCRAMQDSF